MEMEIKGGTEERCTGTDGERKRRRRRSDCCCCEEKRVFLLLTLTCVQLEHQWTQQPQKPLPDWLIQPPVP